MPQCPRCDRDVAATDTRCSGCGQALGAQTPSTGERPAHLAVLDSEPPVATAKPRLVSHAGPAVPASTHLGDEDDVSSTGGWMARLEAAKRSPNAPETSPVPRAASNGTANGSAGHQVATAPPALPPPLPPPLPSSQKPRPSADAFSTKPAHLLVAELEAAEREKRTAKQRRASGLGSVEQEISKSEIANVEIPKPDTEVTEKHIPRWVYALCAAVTVVSVAGIYVYAEKKTPQVVAKADPELIAKAERARKANAAVEEGHAALDPKDPAKIELAITAYKRALAVDPQFARAERALGVAFAAKGDDEEAANHYQRFLDLDPSSPDAAQVRTILDKYAAKTKKP